MSLKYLLYIIVAVTLLAFERVLISIDSVGTNPLFTRVLEIQLFIIYSLSTYKAQKRFGLFHLFTLFLITFGLFNLMKIFYSLISDDNYRVVYSLVAIDLPETVAQQVIWIYTLTLSAIYLSYMSLNNYLKNRYPNPDSKWQFSADSKLFLYGKLTMFLTLGFVIYRCYIEITYFAGLSFTEMYVGGADAIPIPSFVRISSIFFQVGFMMVLGSKPNKKLFLLYSLIYIITISPNLLIGLRNQFALSILFLLWYYVKVFDVRIKASTIFLPVIIAVLFLQIVATQRDGDAITGNLLLLLPLFLTYQSTSMYVLSLYVQNEKIIMPHNYPYLLDPVIGWLSGADGQSLDVLEKRSSLGHQMIYTLSPDAYLSGQSLGTTFIAELYEFGWLGIILGSMILSWLILKFETKVKKNRLYLTFSMFFCSYILISPRSTFLPNIYFLLRYCLVYMFIIAVGVFVAKLIKNKNHSFESK